MRLYLSSFRVGNSPEKLHELLRGKKRTALIANANDFLSKEDRVDNTAQETERLRSAGLEPTEVDLREYFGKTEELKKELASYDLLWVRGGNPFILRRAFRQSGAYKIIKELLAADTVVYGGYSAGVCILSPDLHGIEMVDDPNIVPDGYEPSILWDGLGLLPYDVAPHYKSDHPESAAIDRTVEYFIEHHKPFIALRDGEAIIRDSSKEIVVG